MSSLKTLYYPITDISCQRQFPLFLFFHDLHILQIMEKEARPTDSFMDSPFCQVHTPAPLGSDRERFTRLLQEIITGSSEDIAQLSRLTLSSFASQKEAESEEEIIRAISGDGTTPRNVQIGEEELWQARLVLGIGEILDIKEEEVQVNLTLLDQDSLKIINAVRGELPLTLEDKDLDSDITHQQTTNTIHAGDMNRRFSSWLKLFARLASRDYTALFTSSPTCAETLLDNFTASAGHSAELLTEFNLPAFFPNADQVTAMKETTTFQESNRSRIDAIPSLLEQCQSDTLTSKKAELKQLNQEWNKIIDQSFPENKYGRQRLTTHICPSHDPMSLFFANGGSTEQSLLLFTLC